MARRRHTPEQIIRKLREADRMLAEGKDLAEVARHLEVSEQTYHRWRNQFGGMKADDAKRLRELERENPAQAHRGRQGARDRCAPRDQPGRSYRSSRRRKGGVVGSQGPEDLSSEVALQATDDLLLRAALGDTALHVGLGPRAVAHPNDDGDVQRPVR